jgi:GST-like protein
MPSKLLIAAADAAHEVEAANGFGVIDGRLQTVPWLAGSTYTVADIACFGWIRSASYAEVDLADFLALAAWQARIAARPAVQRAVARMAATGSQYRHS